MQALRDVTSLGILRELHRWGAHAMVITVWLHMYRVFLTGSYKPPREFNWVVGVILLLLTLLLSFTGYLLPWDQLAIWAITVGSNMARATPILGHEGPLHQAAQIIGGIDMITNGSDARYALLGERNRGRGDVESILCVALRRDSAGGVAVVGDPLLAGAERRRHQRRRCSDLNAIETLDVVMLFADTDPNIDITSIAGGLGGVLHPAGGDERCHGAASMAKAESAAGGADLDGHRPGVRDHGAAGDERRSALGSAAALLAQGIEHAAQRQERGRGL